MAKHRRDVNDATKKRAELPGLDGYEYLHTRLCHAIATFVRADYEGLGARCRRSLASLQDVNWALLPDEMTELSARLIAAVTTHRSLDDEQLLEGFKIIKLLQRWLREFIHTTKIRYLATPSSRFNVLDLAHDLEQSILHEGKAAGAFVHHGEKGRAREVFVQRFLHRFLPRSIIVGTGEIADGVNAARSFQQDVVLYRDAFPVIDFHSAQIFLAEGVLGAIEVKTHLGRDEILDCWKKVASVRALEPSLVGAEVEPGRFIGGDFPLDIPLTVEEVEARLRGGMDVGAVDVLLDSPPERIQTYVVAYSAISDEAINDVLETLVSSRGTIGLPDMIVVLGRSLGTRSDDEVLWGRSRKPSGRLPTLEVTPSTRPLGWLLAHIWRGVLGRRRRVPPLRPYFGDEEIVNTENQTTNPQSSSPDRNKRRRRRHRARTGSTSRTRK